MRTRRGLNGMGEIVLTLNTHGLATVETAVRFHEAYGAGVRRDTVSRLPTGEHHPRGVRAPGGTHLKSQPLQVGTVMLPGSPAHQRDGGAGELTVAFGRTAATPVAPNPHCLTRAEQRGRAPGTGRRNPRGPSVFSVAVAEVRRGGAVCVR